MRDETEEALLDLGGTVCRGCGGVKRRSMSHCRRCYFALPRPMRAALYRRVGEGYEKAYAASLAWLRERASEAR